MFLVYMNKREITKAFNSAELEEFTTLPIERMELLTKAIGDSPESDAMLERALDLYISKALSKPALRNVTFRKAYVRWRDKDMIFPVLDKVEVFRYGRRKYLMVAHIVDGTPAS